MPLLQVYCRNCSQYRHEWCNLKVDSPDPDFARDCQYYRGKTNADRIRSMTDEELADFICGIYTLKEDMYGDCDYRLVVEENEFRDDDGLLDWLKSPAEVDE